MSAAPVPELAGAATAAVSVRGLGRTYAGSPPVVALRGVDLDITRGSLLAVLGPSGCGKTTLLRTIAGFERPDTGTITIAGELVAGDGANVPPERRRVGIVPQEGGLFPHLDVAANVGFGLRGRSRTERAARVSEMLELVDLAGYERRRPDQLSGGQQQRVALARALAPQPAVVLLDEPFAALDTALRTTVRSQVVATLAATGTTAVLVTHDQAEALSMAGTIAVMRDGAIVQTGPPAAVYRVPADLTTAQMLGEVSLLAGRPSNGLPDRAHCVLGELAVTAPGPMAASAALTLMLRPEQVVRDDASPHRATVVAAHYNGHDSLLELDLDGVRLAARWQIHQVLAPGEVVGVTATGTAVAYPAPIGPSS